MTEREHELLRELIDLRVKNKFLRERVGYLRADIEAHLLQLTAERDEARAQRDEADSVAHLAETRLREIVELVGEGGDGSAFGSVESMMAANKHLLETLTHQRDMARAEVEMLRGVGCMEEGDGPCGACRKCAYRRGAEAMREAARAACNPVLRSMASRSEIAEAIRVLPIPEDKR